MSDFSNPRKPSTVRYPAGKQPYDGLVTPDGRYFLAGLFGRTGLRCWTCGRQTKACAASLMAMAAARRSLGPQDAASSRLAIAGDRAYLPAVGRHEVLVVDTRSWKEGRPDRGEGPAGVRDGASRRSPGVGELRLPDNGWVNVIDTLESKVIRTLEPGKAVLHMEFTPRGEEVWLSARDDNRVRIIDPMVSAPSGPDAASASGIFFTTAPSASASEARNGMRIRYSAGARYQGHRLSTAQCLPARPAADQTAIRRDRPARGVSCGHDRRAPEGC